ncbi:hypothetical protein ATO67_18535 [Agrobacterium bohemicum]|uniref:Uncharacterized protein n=1 Tax=Agrobacterium bohemicum TaxID=2052828 RepID=A0A135P894_9HYPH|nr:hypothetical protein ATO67_18535 [Agrobacterium bohemicum]
MDYIDCDMRALQTKTARFLGKTVLQYLKIQREIFTGYQKRRSMREKRQNLQVREMLRPSRISVRFRP